MMAGGLTPDMVGVRDGALQVGATRVPLVTELVPDYYGPSSPACRAMLPWRGPMRRTDGSPTFQSFSFYDLFYSQQQVLEGVKPQIAPDTFRDRIVVVGVAGEGLRDVFVTPFAEGRMAGAEVHANTIDAWQSGRTLTPGPFWTGAAVALGLAVGVGATGALTSSAWFTGGAALVIALAYVWTNVRLFAAGGWWPLAVPLLAIVLAFVGDLAWQVLRRRAREAQGEAAVLALRGEGRLRPAAGGSVAGQARRNAPADDRALLRHARLHRPHREGQPGRHCHPAERLLHADGDRCCSSTGARSTSSWATW